MRLPYFMGKYHQEVSLVINYQIKVYYDTKMYFKLEHVF